MFDVVEGFKTKGSGKVSKKHALRILICVSAGFAATAAIRHLGAMEPIIPFGHEFYGGIGAITLALLVDFLREITQLR